MGVSLDARGDWRWKKERQGLMASWPLFYPPGRKLGLCLEKGTSERSKALEF